jgi:hypothetical protein
VTAGASFGGGGSDSGESPIVECQLGLAASGDGVSGGQRATFSLAQTFNEENVLGQDILDDLGEFLGLGGFQSFDFFGLAHNEVTTTFTVSSASESARYTCRFSNGDRVIATDTYIRAVKIG